MPEKRIRRSFSEEFKQDAVDLIVNQGYSLKAAAEAVGIGVQTLRNWHRKLAPEPESCGENATVDELTAEVKRLRKQLKTAEMEREILKKPRRISRRSRSEVHLEKTTTRLLSYCPDVSCPPKIVMSIPMCIHGTTKNLCSD